MRWALLSVVLLAASVAPPAAAKGVISRVELCGARGCEAIAIPEGLHEWPGGAGPTAEPPAVSPFLEVRLTVGRHRQSLWYVPAARRFAWDQHGSIRWTGIWQRIDHVIARAAKTHEPHRATAVAASVGGRGIDGDVSGYLDLFRIGTTVGRSGIDFVRVRVTTDPQSPWSLERLWFYPRTGVLQRGAELVKLPPSVAADVRAARPIGGSESAGIAWPVVGGSLLAAAGVALGSRRLARRGRRSR